MVKSGHQKIHYDGPVVLTILDGVGLSTKTAGNALRAARTKFLDYAAKNYLGLALRASGEAVGISPGVMGNSEVGHNTIGCGQIIKQGIASVDDAFKTGDIWHSDTWLKIIKRLQDNHKTLHFSGILSDGKVHSDIKHLENMIERAYQEGIKSIRVHVIFDGRDVAPQSEPRYIKRLEAFFEHFPDCDYKIASGGGRMVFVTDRYETDWSVVQRGWEAMVHGSAELHFPDATTAITEFRRQSPNIQDQDLPAFVIVDDKNQPVGKVEDGDAFIFYNFRADRAIEIAMAFTYNYFPYFDRGKRPDVFFAGMTEYNSDTHVPQYQLVPPVRIDNPLNNFLSSRGISQLAVSETVKFGHITYYFNGNSYKPAPLEDHIEIPSEVDDDFHTRPWMKAAEVADAVLEKLDQYRFVRINFANGDMVGHHADFPSSLVAMEAVDIQLRRLAQKVDELGGILLITADHGNIEELIDENGVPKTSHTTNPVPLIFYDNTANRTKYTRRVLPDAGLSNIAATIALLLGENRVPASWHPPLITML